MNKFESSLLNTEFQKRVAQELNKSSGLIVGVSGGPDSMALLYLIHRAGLDATAVHCNYMLRGKASDQDQELVEQMCSLWKMECVSVRLDPAERGSENFQNWARNRRYQIFRDLKKEIGADVIATAHHSDDQVETILQKILRGSGLASWKGMEFRDGDLFRPLLSVSKADIMKFVQNFNIPYRIDGSNEESTYARNFLRQNWFPDLDRLFPGWNRNILRLSDRAREFEIMSAHILNDISEHPHRLNRSKFLSLHENIKPVILHRFFEQSGFDLDVSSGFLSELSSLENLQTGGSVQLDDKLFFKRDRDQFLLEHKKEGGFERLKITKEDLAKPAEINNYVISKELFTGKHLPGELAMDFTKVSFPVFIRRWAEGDTFRPLGMEGTQLVSDHLTNRKISSAQKQEAKVVESFDGSIHAVIFPHAIKDGQTGTLSESVKCDETTETVLIIRKK